MVIVAIPWGKPVQMGNRRKRGRIGFVTTAMA